MNKKLLKSLFAVVLAFAGIFAISHYSNAAVKGDVNGDGFVTSADVTSVYDVLLGLSYEYQATADANGDGSVTAADVTYIYDILLGVAPAEFDHVYILGNTVGDWNPAVGQEMTTQDGVTYTATLEAVDAYQGNSWFSFTTKLADAESETPWDDIAAFRFGAVTDGADFVVTNETLGTTISLTKEDYHAFQIPTGKYELTLNLNEMTLVITKIEEPQPETQVWILGEVNGKTWSATEGVEMTTEDNNIFTAHVTTAGENDGYSYFGFTKALADAESETPWDDIASQRFGAVSDGDFLVTSEMAGQALNLTAENGQSFKIPAGEYDLTVNLTEMTLVIEGDIVDPVTPQPENKVYILGTVNGNQWATNNGVEMTTEDNNIYTATITVAEGFGYFSFTTALSEAADDWDGIAQYRFGAVGDADVLVTEEYLGEDFPLTTEGYQAFKIAAGEFTLTLNKEEMTLKVEGTFEQQPEPENNWYLIGTNNGWSTSDMSYKFTQSTENENVYSIHVDNVNGEFWFKIANEDCYTASDFWSGTILSFAINGVNPLSGNLVQGNNGAFCLPANYNATYLDITIDVVNLTYTITTDGQEPQVDPDAEYDYLYIAGDADGWSGNGGKLASVKDANDYYGFFTAGTKFKFQKFQGDWGTNWGGSNGNLVSGGADIEASGYVYVNANTNIGNLTYSITNITSMGVIGDATSGGWDTETALTYNADTNAWEAEVTLTAGTIKFRANGAWDINFGGALDNLTIGGENITVEAGTYKIALTLVCPGEYTATLTPAN